MNSQQNCFAEREIREATFKEKEKRVSRSSFLLNIKSRRLYKGAAQLAAVTLRRADHLDSRPTPQVIIDNLAEEGKAPDSKSNRRKCNPNRECGPFIARNALTFPLALACRLAAERKECSASTLVFRDLRFRPAMRVALAFDCRLEANSRNRCPVSKDRSAVSR